MYNSILELVNEYLLNEKNFNKQQIANKSLNIFKYSCLLFKICEKYYNTDEIEFKITKFFMIYCAIMLLKTIYIFEEAI